MNITLKCFASLARHLPANIEQHAAKVTIENGMSVYQVIDFFNIDRDEADVVILNGVFISAPDRESTILVENDTLALWPEVAGG